MNVATCRRKFLSPLAQPFFRILSSIVFFFSFYRFLATSFVSYNLHPPHVHDCNSVKKFTFQRNNHKVNKIQFKSTQLTDDDNMRELRCTLKSVDQTLPDIIIPENDTVFIGRAPAFDIRDEMVSREHVKATVHLRRRLVVLILLGKNPSKLKDKLMVRDQPYNAKNGDILEILPGQYKYQVNFQYVSKEKDEQ